MNADKIKGFWVTPKSLLLPRLYRRVSAFIGGQNALPGFCGRQLTPGKAGIVAVNSTLAKKMEIVYTAPASAFMLW
jgi:hypothetical protein